MFSRGRSGQKLPDFHGPPLPRDMCPVAKQRQARTAAHVDVRATRGHLRPLFCIVFTKKMKQLDSAQHRQVPQIQKMMDMVAREVQTDAWREVVRELIAGSLGKDAEKPCQSAMRSRAPLVESPVLRTPGRALGKLPGLPGKVLEKLQGMRQVLKADQRMDTSPWPKDLFKIQILMVTNIKKNPTCDIKKKEQLL